MKKEYTTPLRTILEEERISQKLLLDVIKKNCEKNYEKSLTAANICRIVNGTQEYTSLETLHKILKALNELRHRQKEYKLEEIN